MREEGRGRKKETEQNKRGCFFFKTERENHGFDLRSFFFFLFPLLTFFLQINMEWCGAGEEILLNIEMRAVVDGALWQ